MSSRLSTGSRLLDELLGGGFLAGVTNTIYGDPGTGKTTIIMSAILHAIQLGEAENRCAYVIDTEGGWSLTRFASMAKARGLDPNKALEHLRLYKVTELREQHEVAMKGIRDDIKSSKKPPLLLAIDSIASIYHGQLLNTPINALASRARELQGKLSTEINSLLHIASAYEAPSIIVTWTRSAAADAFAEHRRAEAVKAILSGESAIDVEAGLGAWKFPLIGGQHLVYYSKNLIRLYTLENASGDKLAILEKSLEQPTNRCARFRIGDGGVEDIPDARVCSVFEYLQEIASEVGKR